ncbi:hypothetical protein BA724_02790 [Domibacillus iocasae]|uniref:Uncharacterized protein n=1 Tax=Domibacillus iocasae TaxID=1714016 RepID=A0A1E7DRU8_9BACI|nr:hypothetical protein BA724_02790 [Domibacillus iocasae]
MLAAVLFIVCGMGVQSASAKTGTDALFVLIGDAMMNVKKRILYGGRRKYGKISRRVENA